MTAKWNDDARRELQSNQDRRPMTADELNPRPHAHCYDAEKCNAETFCDCPCVRCTRTKRGEYQTR